ncbi:MAG: YjjI family glycine radical enzyme, partial [Spirochaetaceae bacterium]|nr:YjjI family glycine radical enzyme [Spirochaetaceae bacterium]
MQSSKDDIITTATSSTLSYQQKMYTLANVGERLPDPREVLHYTDDEMAYITNDMICDLNEGYLPYRPRYIVPDYSVFLKKGCDFLEIQPPANLDELFDGLLILYHHVPSITSFPVYIGNLDQMIEPFLTDNESDDYIKIKRFLNHIDKTIVDSFCHADIGPYETKAGRHILKAVIELKNPTPNMTLHYDQSVTTDAFAMKAAEACLLASKPSFSNIVKYRKDVGDHAIVSCYNALPIGGGAYTLLRLRLGTIVKRADNLEQFLSALLPDVAAKMLSMMDKRIRFIVEESHFFETSFLQKEGFISRENFTAMFAIVGLADCVNLLLKREGLEETFGQSFRGDEMAHLIMEKLELIVGEHTAPYLGRTDNRYLLHAQVGANLSEEDRSNTPAHRIRVGEEPILPVHLNQSAPFH